MVRRKPVEETLMMEVSSRHDGVKVSCHACFVGCNSMEESLERAVDALPCSRDMLWSEFMRRMEQADG